MTEIIEVGELIEIIEVADVIEVLDLDGGVQGLPGTAATIEVGTVTTGTPSSVTNAGTTSAAVLNFVLEKGDQGDQGYAPLMEYSADGTTWHTPYEGTDLYIHFSMDNGSTWGDTIALAVYTMTWLGSGD